MGSFCRLSGKGSDWEISFLVVSVENLKKKLIKYTFSLNYFKRSNTKQPRSVPIVINVIIIIRTDELIYIYIFVPYMKFLEILE